MEDAFGRPLSPAWFPWYVAGSQVLGLAVLAITGAWMAHYHGGFAWEGKVQFNLHPLCMVIGMVFLCGDALLVYRVFRNETKRATKILHGTLHVFAFVLAMIGIIAVFEYHRTQHYVHLYSLHSWCGIITFALFFVQWIIGSVFFLFPGISISHRSRYKPLHVFFGVTLFIMAIGTSLLGIKEKLLFTFPNNYSSLPAEAVLGNILGLLLVAFGMMIGYIVTRDDWKRPMLPEEQALSMDFKTLTEGAESPGQQ
nr:cytochrome b561 isoform X2 [Geotrypetes seraphini]